MVIFGVSHPEFSTIENINLDLRPGGRSFAIRASGWELPQVLAEALKSSTTRWLELENNDIGDEGAEAPLLDWLRFCGGVVRVGVWEMPEWRIFRVRTWNCSPHKRLSCCREIVVLTS